MGKSRNDRRRNKDWDDFEQKEFQQEKRRRKHRDRWTGLDPNIGKDDHFWSPDMEDR
jgi:hypothetical protein